MRENWTPDHTKRLEALIRRQDRINRRMLVVRPVAELLMWLGFGVPDFYMKYCREGLAIYEAQAKLLGLR